MKINWFSPFPRAMTDVARYTCEVVTQMREMCEVVAWTGQADIDSSLCGGVHIRRFAVDSVPWAEINRADISVFNLGNNHQFHGDIWQLARRHPGLIVLHDLSMHHFFDALYRTQLRRKDLYVEVMRRYYGNQAAERADENFGKKGSMNDELSQMYPLTEHALENATGVLVHNKANAHTLQSAMSVPVVNAPLPFRARLAGRERNGNTRGGSPCRLVMFGHLGTNRRIDKVLLALSEMPEREQFRLHVYGSTKGCKLDITSECSRLNLRHVHVHGFVPEDELERALKSSDLGINLRYPTMGEASGVQLRLWSHALPSLVTPIGWYASLPVGTVGYVRPDENEVADIQAHLRGYLRDPEPFVKMGSLGEAEVREKHSPRACAEAILEAAVLSRSNLRNFFARRLAEHAASVVDGWR